MTGKQSAWLCPHCKGEMVVIERLTAKQIFEESLKERTMNNSS